MAQSSLLLWDPSGEGPEQSELCVLLEFQVVGQLAGRLGSGHAGLWPCLLCSTMSLLKFQVGETAGWAC